MKALPFPQMGCLLLSLILFCSTGLSMTADQSKPCHITSDSATFHQQNSTIEFFGHVVSKQGSSQSWSNYAKGFSNKAGHLNKIVLTGKPAKYTTLSDDDGQPITVSADTIIDYPERNSMYLEGHAIAHHGTDSIEGDKIWYDKVNGTIKSVALASNRTKTVFTIKNKQGQ